MWPADIFKQVGVCARGVTLGRRACLEAVAGDREQRQRRQRLPQRGVPRQRPGQAAPADVQARRQASQAGDACS